MYKKIIYSLISVSFCAAIYAQETTTTPPPKKAAVPVTPTAQPVKAKESKPAVRPVAKAKKTPEEEMEEYDEDWFTEYIINVGAHTEFYNEVQTDDSGSLRQFDFGKTLGLGFYIPMEDQFSFLPEINWVLPRDAGTEKISKNLFMLRADFGYDPIDWFRVRVGTSIMWMNQQSEGGSTQMRNGTSTSTFYYPDENRSSMNNTLDVGAEFLFLENWAARLQTYHYSIFNDDRRQISYSLFVTYYWER